METSNIKAMREALNAIIDTLNEWNSNGEIKYWQYSELFNIADKALSTPPRNCDRFENIKEAKIRYCIEVEKVLIWDGYNSEKLIKWLFDEAKGKTKWTV